MSNLLAEIKEQPEVLRRLIARFPEVERLGSSLRGRDIRYVVIAARGTSSNAATYAKYLFGVRNRLPVSLATPSLSTLYGAALHLQGALVVGISQSGRSPDIVAVVEDARRQGCPTIAITNTPDSPLAGAAEHLIDLGAGPEQSVAATKTYTAQLVSIALLSLALDPDDGGRLAELATLPDRLEEILSLTEDLSAQAARYRYMLQCAVIGRGYNHATALEVALKLKELNYIGTTPYSSAEFRHGPIAVVCDSYPVIAIAPSGCAAADMADLIADLRQRDAELVVISDQADLLAQADTPLRLPGGMPEWLSPMAAVLPGQLLAHHLAIARRLDPERPRSLRKVTETR
jgi:glutamine---fructose-6-phosphate transaminase (isomerizing)